MAASLEQFWSDVLSETPERVTPQLAALDEVDRQAILLHLRRMAAEPGWSQGQRRRAAVALAEWPRCDNQGVPSESSPSD